MKPVYFVINDVERTMFEKKYHAPYGYHTSPAFQTEDGAVGYVESLGDLKRPQYVVERIVAGKVEVIYRGEWFDPSDVE